MSTYKYGIIKELIGLSNYQISITGYCNYVMGIIKIHFTGQQPPGSRHSQDLGTEVMSRVSGFALSAEIISTIDWIAVNSCSYIHDSQRTN